MFGNKKITHKPVHFLRCEDHIANKETQELGSQQCQPRRKRDDWSARTYFFTDQLHESFERIGIEAHSVDHIIVCAVDALHSQLSQVFDVYRLDSVRSIAGNEKERESPQKKGNV